MRSKKRTIGILIVVIVLLLGFASAIFFVNNYNNSKDIEENTSNNIYNEKVDSAIDSVLFTEDYSTLSLDEKKDRMLSILYQLEKDGEILKDSIFYQESEKAIWFQYPDGFEDGVILENSKNGYSGNAKIDNYVERKDEQGRILSYNCDIDFNSNEYLYTAKEVKSLDLKAKFMYGLGFDSVLDEYKKYQTIWIKQYLKTDIDDYCTVEDFKNGLSGYNIVFIEEHGMLYESGGLLKIKTPLICTTEEFIKDKYNDDKANLLFPKSDDGKRYYCIKPSFFKKYYGDEKLKDTIIWIGSCHGYQCDDLVNAFSRCGAKAVIGYDESVLTGYDCVMLNPFVYSLLYGDSVSEALNFAKSIFGEDDLEYLRTYMGTTSRFGTIALMPSGKSNCAVAKLYPGSENARLIDAEIIGAQRGGEIKSKTQSTEFVEIEKIETTEPTTTAKTEQTRILRYNGISADVIIPSRIENKVVTEIGDSTFKDLAGLQKVEIPSTVKSIGEYAFYNCIGLTSITLKDGLEVIKQSAFANCENLPEINLPITLTEIQAKVFSNCKKLKCIEIPDSVISFGTPTDYYEGGAVFSECEALLSVKLSESQTCIPLNSFKDCTSLNDIKIPDSVRTLEEGAFVNCTSLKEIIIPGSVSEINYPGIGSFPDGPFGNCTSLEKVTINEGSLKTISYGMFGGCVSLKEVIIPENIIEIGKFAFNGCESLSQVKLPSQLQYLDINCFKGCVELSEIIIPNTCIYIGEGAFSGCANLSSVTLPENVQAMTIEAFGGCAIQEITIPNNVTSFDFGYCEKLKNITVKGSNTELIISGYFGSDLGSDFNELTIYAPSGSKAETFAKENGVNFSVLN